MTSVTSLGLEQIFTCDQRDAGPNQPGAGPNIHVRWVFEELTCSPFHEGGWGDLIVIESDKLENRV